MAVGVGGAVYGDGLTVLEADHGVFPVADVVPESGEGDGVAQVVWIEVYNGMRGVLK